MKIFFAAKFEVYIKYLELLKIYANNKKPFPEGADYNFYWQLVFKNILPAIWLHQASSIR